MTELALWTIGNPADSARDFICAQVFPRGFFSEFTDSL